MIRYQFFPRSQGITSNIQLVVDCFEQNKDKIKSSEYNLSSNAVLEVLRPSLEAINYVVESGKSQNQKISIPVLFGYNNNISSFSSISAFAKISCG